MNYRDCESKRSRAELEEQINVLEQEILVLRTGHDEMREKNGALHRIIATVLKELG